MLELKLPWADPDVVSLLLLGVEAAEAMHDHRAFDGEAERVLRGEWECLAGVDHRGDGDAADGVGHCSRNESDKSFRRTRSRVLRGGLYVYRGRVDRRKGGGVRPG